VRRETIKERIVMITAA